MSSAAAAFALTPSKAQDELQCMALSDCRRPNRLNNLGHYLGTRFIKGQHEYNKTEKLRDLENTIKFGRKAVRTTSKDHTDRSLFCSNVANALLTLYGEQERS